MNSLLIFFALAACALSVDVDLINYFDEKFRSQNDSLNVVVEGVKALVKSEIQQMTADVKKAISHRHHEYVAEFATVLERASKPIICQINGTTHFGTEHSILMGGYVFTLGVKHCECYRVRNFTIVEFSDADVVFRFGCPMTSAVLNATSYVELRTGDEASTLGYELSNGQPASRFWNGRLAGRLARNQVVGSVQLNSNEYIFQGVAQINGMSGGGTLNGVGYTGMVHGVSSFANSAHLAVVIPASTIEAGLNAIPAAYKNQMKILSDCPGITVLEVPQY